MIFIPTPYGMARKSPAQEEYDRRTEEAWEIGRKFCREILDDVHQEEQVEKAATAG